MVDKRFIRGTRGALSSWLLTSGPTPFCLYKPFSCKACRGISFVQARGLFKPEEHSKAQDCEVDSDNLFVASQLFTTSAVHFRCSILGRALHEISLQVQQKRRTMCQQPRTKSAFRPVDKRRNNACSKMNQKRFFRHRFEYDLACSFF